MIGIQQFSSMLYFILVPGAGIEGWTTYMTYDNPKTLARLKDVWLISLAECVTSAVMTADLPGSCFGTWAPVCASVV